MSIEANKQVVRRFYEEVLNSGKIEALEELAVTNYQEHDMLPGQGDGLAGLRKRVTMLRTALTPRFELDDVIAEGDRVVVRWTNSGTHVGDFMGAPATGRSFRIAGVDVHRVQDGKMAEHWHVVDQLSMLQQLGLIPSNESVG
nr:ester cyclase [Actinomycetota bacterium]